MPAPHPLDRNTDPDSLPALPDFAEEETDELWFLPGEGSDTGPAALPIPRAERRALFDAAEWRAAQGALAAELAQAALRFGRLDERLAGMGQGARVRLAIREVTDLGWWTGDRVAADRLALWLALRAGMAGEDAPALARAGWAVRRLSAGPTPGQGGWRPGVAAFLGRKESVETEEIAEAMEAMQGLHPIVEAAVLFHAWRVVAETRSGPVAGLEAAILAARHGASTGRGGSGKPGALFLPLAMAGVPGLTVSGSAERRLAAWLTGAEQATLSALAQLDRLRDWEARAQSATADLSGRTPRALIATLAAWPAVSAPMAEAETGASRAAVQRNLDLFAARGLVREITGQGRYRVWVEQR